MKMLLMILMLFGLGCTVNATGPVKQSEMTTATRQVGAKFDETKTSSSIDYCPLSETACRNMQERVAAQRVHLQPILVTDGKNPEAMTQAWDDFVASLPEEIASALERPKLVTAQPNDIQEQEGWVPQLDRHRLANNIGALPDHTLALVYWDLSLGGNFSYDWDNGIYYRSFYAEATSDDRKDYLGRRFEEAFLAWLINIHV